MSLASIDDMLLPGKAGGTAAVRRTLASTICRVIGRTQVPHLGLQARRLTRGIAHRAPQTAALFVAQHRRQGRPPRPRDPDSLRQRHRPRPRRPAAQPLRPQPPRPSRRLRLVLAAHCLRFICQGRRSERDSPSIRADRYWAPCSSLRRPPSFPSGRPRFAYRVMPSASGRYFAGTARALALSGDPEYRPAIPYRDLGREARSVPTEHRLSGCRRSATDFPRAALWKTLLPQQVRSPDRPHNRERRLLHKTPAPKRCREPSFGSIFAYHPTFVFGDCLALEHETSYTTIRFPIAWLCTR